MSLRGSIERQYEATVDQLDRDIDRGYLTPDEYDEEVAELERDARAAIREAAEEAYADVMGGEYW